MKFKLGQEVYYTTIGKYGRIAAIDVGLGYYVDVGGWRWSAPETSLLLRKPQTRGLKSRKAPNTPRDFITK